jgi:hypothetical protein
MSFKGAKNEYRSKIRKKMTDQYDYIVFERKNIIECNGVDKYIKEEYKKINTQKNKIVEKFIEYARANGSHRYLMYRKHFSNLLVKKYQVSSYDSLPLYKKYKIAEDTKVIYEEIKKGLEDEIDYRQIYQNTKDRILNEQR